jgi:hypothetical protein
VSNVEWHEGMKPTEGSKGNISFTPVNPTQMLRAPAARGMLILDPAVTAGIRHSANSAQIKERHSTSTMIQTHAQLNYVNVKWMVKNFVSLPIGHSNKLADKEVFRAARMLCTTCTVHP